MSGYGRSSSNSSDRLFHRSESVPHVMQRLVEMLDHIEERVELLREHASAMENEREALLSVLSAIKSNKDLQYVTEGEREEIEITALRLMNRTQTVEVSVTTPRNELQQQALDKVEKFYTDLQAYAETDPAGAKATLQSYINACLSDCKGAINQKFQAAVLECTADDQKRTRKKLESLMASLSMSGSSTK
ncbi:BAG family molecular chaperone regulator 2-like isoform X2 [Stegodyphus dumicola]|nr:BAG family molecular chaperone regulator 2-like isoform X2 [Stegodyphus dumicola]XP_035224227.1 BAG family molecular chaperone regulator 2-like isoform X2 [Stegodyphus dumicola]